VVHFRTADPSEDPLIAEQFFQLWLENGIPANCLRTNWLEGTLEFIAQARRELGYQAFVAEVDSRVVGSAGCQLFAGLYPQPFVEEYRKYGYIWNVYVEPPHRRQGIATELTKLAIAHLKSLHCTRVLLHASPSGQPVYTNLGFSPSNELRLDI
jgi:GNAT superfamily N-acetyltransferase